jgi:BED zinc finger
MPQTASNLWQYVTKIASDSKNPTVQCKYCDNSWKSNSVDRIRIHLRRCPELPLSLKPMFQGQGVVPTIERDTPESSRRSESISSFHQTKLEQYSDKITDSQQKEYDRLLARFLYMEGLPFRLVYI